jgi:hypothetical protein
VNVIPSSGRSSKARFASSRESRRFTSWTRVKIDESWSLQATDFKIGITTSASFCKKFCIGVFWAQKKLAASSSMTEDTSTLRTEAAVSSETLVLTD